MALPQLNLLYLFEKLHHHRVVVAVALANGLMN